MTPSPGLRSPPAARSLNKPHQRDVMEPDRSTLVVATSTLTALPDAAFATDAIDGRIIAWNTAATGLTGVPRRVALDATCGTLLDGIDDAGGAVCSVDCPHRRTLRYRTRDDRDAGARDLLPGACTTWDPHPDMLIPTPTGRRRVAVVSIPALIDGRRAMLHVLRPCEGIDS